MAAGQTGGGPRIADKAGRFRQKLRLVEPGGIEPPTSSLRTGRKPPGGRASNPGGPKMPRTRGLITKRVVSRSFPTLPCSAELQLEDELSCANNEGGRSATRATW